MGNQPCPSSSLLLALLANVIGCPRPAIRRVVLSTGALGAVVWATVKFCARTSSSSSTVSPSSSASIGVGADLAVALGVGGYGSRVEPRRVVGVRCLCRLRRDPVDRGQVLPSRGRAWRSECAAS